MRMLGRKKKSKKVFDIRSDFSPREFLENEVHNRANELTELGSKLFESAVLMQMAFGMSPYTEAFETKVNYAGKKYIIACHINIREA